MILTTSELIAALQQEVRVLLHLAGKVDRSMLEYRPTPKQRSTLELLQYMAIMGPTQLTVIEHGVFDRPTLSATWSPPEAEAKKMSFDHGREELSTMNLLKRITARWSSRPPYT